MKRLIAIALLLGSAAGRAAPAAPDPIDPIDPLQGLRTQLAAQDLLRGAYALQQGEAVQSWRIDAGALQPYRIGSITKLFTAVLVLQLVDEGRVALDDPLTRWFPDWPQGASITVGMLLAHRSGLGDLKDAPDFERWARQPRSEAELQALIAGLPRPFAPGTRASYNNSGYLLLHALVERASGQPYAERLAARIARPLGLQHTQLAQPGEGLASYAHDGTAWQPVAATHPSVPRGAGALVSTPADLTRFIRALFQGRLLKPATLARMTQLQDGFGLGLVALPAAGPWQGQGFGHEGVIDGFRAVLVYLPQHDLAAAVLLNGERWPRDALLHELLASRLQPGHRPPDLRPQAQAWTVRAVAPELPAGAHLALRGSQPPLRWDRGLPLQPGPDGRLQLALDWQGVSGLALETKLVLEDSAGRVLRWESDANRRWLPGEPPGLLRFNLKGEAERVWQAVEAADAALFAAFNRRDAAAMAPYFSERLEFFHDRSGLTDKAYSMRVFAQNFARADLRLRRELLPDSVQIHPVPGVGAMHIGRHRFCAREGDAPEGCSEFGFSQVWEEREGRWSLLRVLSYGH